MMGQLEQADVAAEDDEKQVGQEDDCEEDDEENKEVDGAIEEKYRQQTSTLSEDVREVVHVVAC